MSILLSTIAVFTKANDNLSIIIPSKLSNLISSKLGNGNYDYEYIKDFNGLDRYILVSSDNSYMIYDSFIDDYIEYSNFTTSPFSSINSNHKIYLAPTYYFYKNNNNYYDLSDDSLVSNEILYKYIEMEEFLKDDYSQKKNLNSNEDNRSIEYISKSYYFQNLKNNIGSNTSSMFPGSCAYVATEMLLAYYDSVANDDIIPEFFDVNVSKTFSTYASINCSSYTESPGINDLFHSFLIGYGCGKGYTDLLNGTEGFHIDTNLIYNLLIDYFNSVDLDINAYTANGFSNKVLFCKDAIDTDNPVIIKIVGTDTSVDPRDLNHTVVGYGYDGTGIFAHFGWKGTSYTNININNYTIDKAVYMTYEDVHNHSNNYLWTIGDFEGTVCPCGSKDCHHTSYDYVWYNYVYHYENCICGSIHTLKPHIISSKDYVEGKTYYTCLLCGGQATSGFVGQGLRDDDGNIILPNGVIVLNNN